MTKSSQIWSGLLRNYLNEKSSTSNIDDHEGRRNTGGTAGTGIGYRLSQNEPRSHSAEKKPTPPEWWEVGMQERLDKQAIEVVRKKPGEDGVVDLTYQEFLDVFRAEVYRFHLRNNEVGGYANMPAWKFLREEAYGNADSFFYGREFGGGAFYRIVDAPASLGVGPYQGGNLNYINQGLIFAARGDSLFEAKAVVSGWNGAAGLFGNTDSEHLELRLRLTEHGYNLWRTLP